MVTEATFAVNDTLFAVAGTVTELATVTELLLLASATLIPPVGAEPDRLTVHVSARAPVIDVLPHETAETVGAAAMPVPLRLTVTPGAVLEMVSCPVDEIALVGSNWTESTVACPGFSVVGRFPPETENPVPEIESELMVTAAVPLEVTVTDLETAVPTETLPNARDVELRLSVGTAAFSCRAKLCEELFELAVTVAVCAAVTAATLALKDALEAPPATVTLAGTDTAPALLARLTLCPPL